MARAKPVKTKYPRVYKKDTIKGRVYDFYVLVNGKQAWTKGKHTNLEEANRHRDQLQKQADLGFLPSGKPRTLDQFTEEDYLPHQGARVQQGNLQARPSTSTGTTSTSTSCPRLAPNELST